MITIIEQIKCVERELERRKNAYPGRVAVGYMAQSDADVEIAIMEAVLDTLKRIPLMPLPECLLDREAEEDD